ncbi:DNA internalization-related competence protein ComEC/Rec2 [uncultured Paraglaciecola sp.]|uniref:DNA internalization-related competence protein ComEC/Rec2 n=1 Tax=uncultured Paraglaciecola sp. TaxID=1765024 RepID=UPI0030D8F73B|tara:strand:- start:17698 stop:19977 length:2280 start_codon:yes stop_codon:yes gene_type:complete
MDGRLFSFIAASMSALFWLSLPALFILPIILCLIILLWRWSHTISSYQCVKSLSIYFLLGIFWMASVGHWQQTWQLQADDFTQGIWVKGQVASLIDTEKSTRFNLDISNIDERILIPKRRIRVSWTKPLWPIKQGHVVQLWVKLKPPHGLANQGAFHYQQWLFSQEIVATGYVKANKNNSLLESSVSLRQRLLDQIMATHLTTVPWIAALALGHRGLLTPDDWLLVQRTGIAHLIAISGLHLALVASLCYLFIATVLLFCYRVLIKAQKVNFYLTSVGITLLATLGYAYLAGLGLPAMRAWLMLTLAAFLLFTRTHWAFKRIFLVSVSGFILLFPLSLFGQSFWLSFSAILIIGFVFWRWPIRHNGFSIKAWFAGMCRLQLALSILMLPLVAWQFSFISLVAPLVNLIAVPIVTLIFVPLCLLAIMMMLFSLSQYQAVLSLVDKGLMFSLDILTAASDWSGAALNIQAIPALAWIGLTLATVTMLLPKGLVPRIAALVLCIPLLSFGLRTQSTQWQVNVLDVGQGLSVVISRYNKALVYDVGASYPSGFNMADSALVPYLRSRGISQVNALVLSHFDNDHSGSLPALRRAMPMSQIYTTKDVCRQGWELTWQGLNIFALWPDDPTLHSDNNSSCVLQITDGFTEVLLTGDIDASVEQKLVSHYGTLLQSHILLAPHHGSNTSSSREFINAVAPDYVIFSQGFMNRWGFPRNEVLKRYQQTDAALFRTSEQGQIQLTIGKGAIKVKRFREDIYPYWYANH